MVSFHRAISAFLKAIESESDDSVSVRRDSQGFDDIVVYEMSAGRQATIAKCVRHLEQFGDLGKAS